MGSTALIEEYKRIVVNSEKSLGRNEMMHIVNCELLNWQMCFLYFSNEQVKLNDSSARSHTSLLRIFNALICV